MISEGYTQEELRKVKDAELRILKEVDDCCSKLQIKYFIAYGTALGAIRHNGFIPWDDDIDIGMKRNDYERFLREAPNYLCSRNLFLEDLTTEPTCPYPWAKVRMNDTVFVEYCHRNVKMHHGVYIDVFPFDELPIDVEQQREQYNETQKWVHRFAYRQTPDITEKPDSIYLRIKFIVRRLLHYSMHVYSARFLYSKIIKSMTRYNGSNTKIYGCQFYPKFQAGYMTDEMINNLQRVQFENIETYVPGNVDLYLSSQYGDYMKFPPVEQRIGHRPYKVKI